jgi:hypothetical protein
MVMGPILRRFLQKGQAAVEKLSMAWRASSQNLWTPPRA